ncbi:hypothetical protein ES705_34491 [subsurface metagenome]
MDDAVTTPKILDDAVTEDKILNNAVSVDKIKNNAVTTFKILDEAVTEPKLGDDALSQRLLESLLVRQDFFFDDFHGANLAAPWQVDILGAGALVFDQSCIKMTTAANANDYVRCRWGGPDSLIFNDAKPRFLVKTKRDAAVHREENYGLWFDIDNRIHFRFDENVGGAINWRAICWRGGVGQSVDTSIAVTAAEQELKIVYEAINSVKFYINGALVHTETDPAAIPITEFEPWLDVSTDENVAKIAYVDYVLLTQDRARP